MGKGNQKKSVGRAPFIAALVISLVGVYLAVELIGVHQAALDPNAPPSECNYSETWRCDDVATSDWSTVIGVPTAAWGLLIYAGFALLAIAGLRRRIFPKGPGGLLLWGAAGALLFGLYLISVMVSMDRYCTKCLGLDAVHLGLVICGLLAVRGRGVVGAIRGDLEVLGDNRPAAIAIVGGSVLAGILVLAAYPEPPESGSDGSGANGGGDDGDRPPPTPENGFPEPRGEIELEGAPARGPDDAQITVIEFSDYQCPFCQAAHEEVREVVDGDRDRFRFIHFHYPLDMACNDAIPRPFHPHACLAAAAALCAQDQGRFWELNDLLFQNGRQLDRDLLFDLVDRAAGIDREQLEECLTSGRTRERVAHDLEQGRQVPVEGTPTFIINGRVVSGFRPGMYRALLGMLLSNDGRWPERFVGGGEDGASSADDG